MELSGPSGEVLRTVPSSPDNGTVWYHGPMRNKAGTGEAGTGPTTENGTVPPRRTRNEERHPREYLTQEEVERLMKVATDRGGRYGHRDATMILVAYRHGLRASELTDLRWDQIEFASASLHVRRVKQGTPATHPILGDELRALRRLQREQEPKSPFVFTSERGAPFTGAGEDQLQPAQLEDREPDQIQEGRCRNRRRGR